ncbi:hypothetical protein [Bacillus subtilis]|uniref:hypothetical protein n=1 Tax=Bacillus subtilis TaxID=1423 RepID=UPI002DBFD1D4|nr:hypothetical protein [Bacillus subtilis]MEC3664973.1 hypothetical protein [Bacillus subtilis]
MKRISLKEIQLNRYEGIPVSNTVTSWAEAESTLCKWAATAPEEGAYDKVGFCIIWTDESQYNGRFDLQRKHLLAPHPLSLHVMSELTYACEHADAKLKEIANDMVSTLDLGSAMK